MATVGSTTFDSHCPLPELTGLASAGFVGATAAAELDLALRARDSNSPRRLPRCPDETQAPPDCEPDEFGQWAMAGADTGTNTDTAQTPTSRDSRPSLPLTKSPHKAGFWSCGHVRMNSAAGFTFIALPRDGNRIRQAAALKRLRAIQPNALTRPSRDQIGNVGTGTLSRATSGPPKRPSAPKVGM